MALFEKYPKDVRKMIALSITILVGIFLLGTMFFVYISKSKNNTKENEVTSKILNFYNAILEKDVLFQK